MVKLSHVVAEAKTPEDARDVVNKILNTNKIVDIDLDIEPSISFLDGLVVPLHRCSALERVTFVYHSDQVYQHLSQLVSHDPSKKIWVRGPDLVEVQVLPSDVPVRSVEELEKEAKDKLVALGIEEW